MMSAPRILGAERTGPYVVICDHASNDVPAELHNLGLPEAELARHIGWDIGAAGVAEALSEILKSPAIFSAVSRLVIDCNRHLDALDLIPEISDGTIIPGNLHMIATDRSQRVERYFVPYHDAVESVLVEREARGVPSILISVHSMTESLAGIHRPWQIALSSYLDRSLADPVLVALRHIDGIAVGDNQPYDLDPTMDYSTPFHALRRGVPHLQVEFRQDEISDPASQRQWAAHLATALQNAKTVPRLRIDTGSQVRYSPNIL